MASLLVSVKEVWPLLVSVKTVWPRISEGGVTSLSVSIKVMWPLFVSGRRCGLFVSISEGSVTSKI